MRTAIGGGPVLVKDGLIHVTNEEEQMFVKGENDRHPRTAMGYNNKRQLLILAIQGRFQVWPMALPWPKKPKYWPTWAVLKP
ncbi:phosphodiester glycosidase family protein [Paraflavitalea speifideaquila]|uniref:phosphodiester glycosidase family protein n=1 Tax=Paraflavitalea speifideaquila TaxID=3076558 RepID=UPI0033130718